MRRGYGYRHSAGDGLIGLAIMIGLAAMALPFVGAYKLVTGKDEGDKVLGGVLLVIGIVIYLMAAFN